MYSWSQSFGTSFFFCIERTSIDWFHLSIRLRRIIQAAVFYYFFSTAEFSLLCHILTFVKYFWLFFFLVCV